MATAVQTKANIYHIDESLMDRIDKKVQKENYHKLDNLIKFIVENKTIQLSPATSQHFFKLLSKHAHNESAPLNNIMKILKIYRLNKKVCDLEFEQNLVIHGKNDAVIKCSANVMALSNQHFFKQLSEKLIEGKLIDVSFEHLSQQTLEAMRCFYFGQSIPKLEVRDLMDLYELSIEIGSNKLKKICQDRLVTLRKNLNLTSNEFNEFFNLVDERITLLSEKKSAIYFKWYKEFQLSLISSYLTHQKVTFQVGNGYILLPPKSLHLLDTDDQIWECIRRQVGIIVTKAKSQHFTLLYAFGNFMAKDYRKCIKHVECNWCDAMKLKTLMNKCPSLLSVQFTMGFANVEEVVKAISEQHQELFGERKLKVFIHSGNLKTDSLGQSFKKIKIPENVFLISNNSITIETENTKNLSLEELAKTPFFSECFNIELSKDKQTMYLKNKNA